MGSMIHLRLGNPEIDSGKNSLFTNYGPLFQPQVTGIGNLHNFYQGLLKINVLNNVLVIYDNDAEGSNKLAEARQLDTLPNIRIMKLPDLEEFEKFITIGPTGEQCANINGKAAAIECFLDLNWGADVSPRVGWTGYHRRGAHYQGELEGKEPYFRRFLELTSKQETYDYSKIEILVDRILEQCTAIAGYGAA